MTIPLGERSLFPSSNLPGPQAWNKAQARSLFGLASGGVCHTCPLPDERCALTAPFHPCPHLKGRWRYLSVALSVRSLCPGVTRHRYSVKSGLSSPAEAEVAIRLSGAGTMRWNASACQTSACASAAKGRPETNKPSCPPPSHQAYQGENDGGIRAEQYRYRHRDCSRIP